MSESTESRLSPDSVWTQLDSAASKLNTLCGNRQSKRSVHTWAVDAANLRVARYISSGERSEEAVKIQDTVFGITRTTRVLIVRIIPNTVFSIVTP